jgi:hypothetical protein
MSRQSELAFAHQDRIVRIGDQLAKRIGRIWRQEMDLRDLDLSWMHVAPLLQQQVAAAQTTAAELSAPYLDAVDRSYAFDAESASIEPQVFANVMGDGREVAPALFGAVTNAKTLIGRGMPATRAFEVGAHFVAAVASAALHDMSRNADRVLAAGKGYTTYIRVVNGSACSRCAILAGMYSGPDAFLRHVSCQCGVVPIVVGAKTPSGLHDSPGAYFDSLSKEQQDKRFTNAGAEAIRQGASPVSVVNARRGAYGIGYSGHTNLPISRDIRNQLHPIVIGVKTDGTPLRVFATTEGTTARGSFYKGEREATRIATASDRYRRTTTIRLMPEQIAKMAGQDPARWRELLIRYGYLEAH